MSNRFFSILMLFILLGSVLPVSAQDIEEAFNPNNIISDSEMLDSRSMSLSEIQSFLESKNSYLANYVTTNAYGTPNKTAAEIIYDAANNNYDCQGANLSDEPTETERKQKCQHITTINPKVILTTIQKESSLIETSFGSKMFPTESDLLNFLNNKHPLGYGCPDSGGCNPRYKSFAKQVNSTALQFLHYMTVNAPDWRYAYRANQTYVLNNTLGLTCEASQVVTIENNATAALYIFTPHVFNGNYNFYRLYKKYFPKTVKNYPDGSLLQVSGEAGVWLIQNGQKRPFTSYSALISRFNPKKIINVETSALNAYSKGDPIKFPNYSLIQVPTGDIYLLVDNEKRPITSKDIFKKIGFNPEEIIKATAEELASYTEGKTITATSTYPTGKLIQDPKSGGVFYVESGYKYPITDKVFLTTKFKDKKVTKGTTVELNKYTKGSPVVFGDGELLMSNSVSTVYLISEGRKRPFSSGEVFEKLGYKFSNVITVSPQLLAQYPAGDPVVIQTITE